MDEMDSLLFTDSNNKMESFHALVSKPGPNLGLGSKRVWGFIFDNDLTMNQFQKVGTHILFDFALVDDEFHFPNIENTFVFIFRFNEMSTLHFRPP